MNVLALFAGAGGGILGGKLLGWRTVCAVEINAYARNVLLARQRDGILEPFPIWDDVTTFDGNQWRGRVDLVSGGFPCQDISTAGNGAGIDGERSGLWAEFARIISEVQPAFVFVENSPALLVRGIHRVLGDLAALGYNAEWGVLGACAGGAPHSRERMWIMAYAKGIGLQGSSLRICNGESSSPRVLSEPTGGGRGFCSRWWEIEPGVCRVANGVADRVDRARVSGNGQVPAVVRKAWHVLCQRGRVAAEHYGNRSEHRLTAAVCNAAGH